MREWFFQEMNRAEPRGLFLMDGEMAASQNDGARVRVAGAQIVEEFLAEIGNGVDVENEEIGLSL